MKSIKKILDLLGSKERKKAGILLIMIFIMALLDMVGVVSVMPFMGVLTNPQLVESNEIIFYAYQMAKKFGVTSIEQFILVLGILSFLSLMISLVFRSLTFYLQIRFALMLEYSIGKNLLEGYLHQSYAWFLDRNSADLSKTILSDVNQVIYQTIVPMMTLVTYVVVSAALITLLVFTDPILAMILCLAFIGYYTTIFLLIKNFLFHIGTQLTKANKSRFIVINEAFGAIKEVKVGALEKTYINRFAEPAKIYAKNQTITEIIAQLPRFFLEGIAFGGMILLALVIMTRNNGNFTQTIPILVLYAFVGYRLMPILQLIYNAITHLRFSGPSLELLHKDLISLKLFEKPFHDAVAMPFTKNIVLQNIYFSYPNIQQATLKNINLTISALSKTGIVGFTGSGKSTLVDVILGLTNPQKGLLLVDGQPLAFNNKRSWQKIIGYVPQQIYLADDTVSANIAFGLDPKMIDQNSIERAAKIANIHNFIINELPNGYNTIVGERGSRLSGGQSQRIGIARALYNNPQILILDEATSSLDNLTEDLVMQSLNKLKDNITIIIIAHRLSTIKNCDQIYFLEKGEIKEKGTYEDLILNNEKFKRMIKNN
jgi:ABC-type multidrug transport system fused ATPase/permease subunit